MKTFDEGGQNRFDSDETFDSLYRRFDELTGWTFDSIRATFDYMPAAVVLSRVVPGDNTNRGEGYWDPAYWNQYHFHPDYWSNTLWKKFKKQLPAGKRKRYFIDDEEVELPEFVVPGYKPVELPPELQSFLDDSELDWDDLLKIDELSISPFLDQFQEWAMERYPHVPQQDLIMAIVKYIVLVDAMMALEVMEL